MHVLTIINPTATSSTDRDRRAVLDTLRRSVEVTVVETTHRGHAGAIAAAVDPAATPVVLVVGGDGTVNEVVNGMHGRPGTFDPEVPRPRIGVVPTGSANVFGRSLGIAREPRVATRQFLRLLARGSQRTVNLAHTADRWFTFNAGLGVDADVVEAVDRARRERGAPASPLNYVGQSITAWRRAAAAPPSLRLELPDGRVREGLPFTFITNTSPWTYLGPIPVVTNQRCSWSNGLSVFAARQLDLLSNLRMVGAMIAPGVDPEGGVFRSDDLPWLHVTSDVPVRFQIDGDDMGDITDVRFTSVPRALTVVAPSWRK